MKLEVTELESSRLCFCMPFSERVHGTDLLEQNVGATVLHSLISKEIREGCCSLYHVSPINWSNSLLFCMPDTVIPRSSESAAGPQTSNNAAGCSFIVPWEGRPESQRRLATSLAHGLGFFGREEVAICLQAPASWPSPKEELLYPSLEDSDVKCAGKLLAATWNLQNAVLFFSRFWEGG